MVNQWIGIGRLTKDVDVKFTQSGSEVVNFSIACNEKWVDKSSGEKKELVEYVRVVAFGNLASICSKYLSKGKLVFISGRLQTRSWEKDGITRYTTEIVANNMQMLEKRGQEQEGCSGGQQDDSDVPF